MWFNIQYDSSTETSVTIRVPSSFYRDQLVRQYQKYLEDKLFDLTGKRIGIDFIVVKPTTPETQASQGVPGEELQKEEVHYTLQGKGAPTYRKGKTSTTPLGLHLREFRDRG